MAERATVTFHTTPETKARLEKLATVTKRSKSWLTNEAVEQYLAAEEAFVSAVEEGLAEAETGARIPHSEASTYLRSLGSDAPLPGPATKPL